MTLPFGTELAAGTLRALARRQGSVLDSDRAEAPGKIPHELRRTSYLDPSAGLDLPPVYYGTIDATPLWISLLHDAWKWGLRDRRVEALLPNLQAATRWLTEFAAPDPDDLLKYIDASGKGLANQGWKDSGDAIRWRDGHVADAPIALCEARAYAIEAASAAAELFNHFNIDGSAGLNDYAEQMRARFRGHFWVGPQGGQFIGLAVDGHGQTVDGLGSNMGHVLGTGTLNAEEVERVAHTLTSPELLSRHGICTLASDNVGFNPIGYHTGSIWTHDTAMCAWGWPGRANLTRPRASPRACWRRLRRSTTAGPSCTPVPASWIVRSRIPRRAVRRRGQRRPRRSSSRWRSGLSRTPSQADSPSGRRGRRHTGR